MIKRTVLFLATNLLVMVTISILISILGLNHFFLRHGIDYQTLALFCLLWGMGGSLVSLFLSKFMAKISMGVVVINPRIATNNERYLLELVTNLAEKAGLKRLPEVGVYPSPELNAFATGYSRHHSLVAVSSGLLNHLNRDEVEAVLGHEISHIANGDMVTLSLVQGVVNAFTLFLSRIAAYAASIALARNDENDHEFSYLAYNIFTLVFDILFTLLGSILVSAFSRWREYRADKGGATLAGRDKMIAALRRLQTGADIVDDRAPALAAFKISHHPGWLDLFSSHPPIEKRIERLAKMSA